MLRNPVDIPALKAKMAPLKTISAKAHILCAILEYAEAVENRGFLDYVATNHAQRSKDISFLCSQANKTDAQYLTVIRSYIEKLEADSALRAELSAALPGAEALLASQTQRQKAQDKVLLLSFAVVGVFLAGAIAQNETGAAVVLTFALAVIGGLLLAQKDISTLFDEVANSQNSGMQLRR